MKKDIPGIPISLKNIKVIILFWCVHFGTSLLDNQKESEQKNSLIDLNGGVILHFVQQGKPEICFWADKWKLLIFGQKVLSWIVKYCYGKSQTISCMFMLTICLEISDFNLSVDDAL